MATAPSTGNTSASALPAAGGTSESTISNWAGPYITNMLGKAQAIANEPYQVYQGPMTAGTSNLQNKVFQGLGGLSFPGNLGKSFASPVGGNTNNFGGPGGPAVMPQQGMSMPNYGMGAPQAPKTEDDWNKFSSMAFFAPGTDMAKAKADFLAGGQGGGPDKNNPLFAGVGAMPPGGDVRQYTSNASAAPTASADSIASMQKQMATFNPSQLNDLLSGKSSLGSLQQQTPQQYDAQPQLPPTPQQGIAGLTAPQTSQQPSSIAQSYMNPYLESVLAPQMAELRRQNDITNMATNAKLTGAGAFGGSRQALMNAENNRNLMTEQNKTVGQGYANAFDKAMGQFNTEQGQSKDLVNMLANAGAAERGIEQEGITADYNEFLAQRDDPMKKTQYLQSMLQGLPYQTVTNTPLPKSGIGQLVEAFGGMTQLEDALKKFKLG